MVVQAHSKNKPNYTVNFDFSRRQFLKKKILSGSFIPSSFVFSEDIKIDLIRIKNT